jgi:hypothetical protein
MFGVRLSAVSLKKTRQALRRSGACLIAGQRTGQTLIAWAETPSWRATSAWWVPAANNSARAAVGLRGGRGGRVLVVPQGGEEQLAWRRPSPVGQQGTNSTHISPQSDTQEPLQ